MIFDGLSFEEGPKALEEQTHDRPASLFLADFSTDSSVCGQ